MEIGSSSGGLGELATWNTCRIVKVTGSGSKVGTMRLAWYTTGEMQSGCTEIGSESGRLGEQAEIPQETESTSSQLDTPW